MKNIIFKTLVFIFIALLATSFNCYGQDEPGTPITEQLRTAKIGLISKNLNLSADQAQKFWPVYNLHDEAIWAVRKEMHLSRRKLNNRLEGLEDNEILSLIGKVQDLRKKELELEEKMRVDLLKVITPRQLVVLYKTEREFTRMLIQKAGGGMGRGPGPHFD